MLHATIIYATINVVMNVEDPCRKGLSFMYYLIHPQADFLLDKMSPTDMVIYDDVLRRLEWWDEIKDSKYSNDIEKIDDYIFCDIDSIAKHAWTTAENVGETLKELDDIDIIEVEIKGKKKYFIKEV